MLLPVAFSSKSVARYDGSFYLIIRDSVSESAFPLKIDQTEYAFLKVILEGGEMERPLMPDLFGNILEKFAAGPVRAEIHSKEGQLYLADFIVSSSGPEQCFDCRPSDGIILALRCGGRVFIDEDVFRLSISDPSAVALMDRMEDFRTRTRVGGS